MRFLSKEFLYIVSVTVPLLNTSCAPREARSDYNACANQSQTRITTPIFTWNSSHSEPPTVPCSALNSSLRAMDTPAALPHEQRALGAVALGVALRVAPEVVGSSLDQVRAARRRAAESDCIVTEQVPGQPGQFNFVCGQTFVAPLTPAETRPQGENESYPGAIANAGGPGSQILGPGMQ